MGKELVWIETRSIESLLKLIENRTVPSAMNTEGTVL
jgi:hypothetical protein